MYLQTREARVFKQSVLQVGFDYFRVDTSLTAHNGYDVNIESWFMKQSSCRTQWLFFSCFAAAVSLSVE